MVTYLLKEAPTLSDADTAMRAGEFHQAETLLSRIAARANDFNVWLRLAAVRRRCGDHTGALEALAMVLALRPADFTALLMRGSILSAFGRREEAARAYRDALLVAPPDHVLPPPIRAEMVKAREVQSQDDRWRNRVRAIGLDSSDAKSCARLEQLRDDLLSESDGPLLLEGLATVGYYDPHKFPGVAEFEAATPDILNEFQRLIAQRAPELVANTQAGHSRAGVAANVGQSRKWSAIHLISDGEQVAQNAALAPVAVELYERLNPPRIKGRSPNLMFSILDPHTKIPPHHGIINSRLVIHIPLIVPDHCALRVGEETREWHPGTALIFDDTIEHEAWNNSDQLRVVLLGDLWRPELGETERNAIAEMMARD